MAGVQQRVERGGGIVRHHIIPSFSAIP
jgi:hypothetical protein